MGFQLDILIVRLAYFYRFLRCVFSWNFGQYFLSDMHSRVYFALFLAKSRLYSYNLRVWNRPNFNNYYSPERYKMGCRELACGKSTFNAEAPQNIGMQRRGNKIKFKKIEIISSFLIDLVALKNKFSFKLVFVFFSNHFLKK